MRQTKTGFSVRPLIYVLSLLVGLTVPSARASSFVVNTTADAGPGSLRQALADANAGGGGDIVFSNVTGTNFLLAPLPVIATDINIVGPGASVLAISGNGVCRVFDVSTNATCVISGLTMRDGWVEVGGDGDGGSGIRNRGHLTLNQCDVTQNRCRGGYASVGPGGGIDSRGSLVLNGVTLSGNLADGSGGGIYSDGSLTINDSQVLDNDATEGYGGGIACFGTSVLSNVTIAGNAEWTIWEGGGLYGEGDVTLTNCSVTENYDDTVGGGIGFSGNNLYVLGSVISNNWASRICGGIYDDGSNMVVCNSSICSNRGSAYVGGIGVVSGTASLSNCVVFGNCAFGPEPGPSGLENWSSLCMVNCTLSGNYGTTCMANDGTATALNCTIAFNQGGVNNSGTFYARNTIIANNTQAGTKPDFEGALTSQGYNLIGNLTSATVAGDATGNIYGWDPNLGPLQDNGGPTWTHALLAGSPAIGSGTSDGAPAFDQRGVARPVGAVDMGAFQYTLAGPTGDIGSPAKMMPPVCSPGGVMVCFCGVVGRTYSLQRAPSVAGPWSTLGSVTVGLNGLGSLQDTNPPAGCAFFRTVRQ